jgi:predicted acylesterase/phospholipase RssA
VAIGDQRLIDGGVVNNTPISHAVALGAERVPPTDFAQAGRLSAQALAACRALLAEPAIPRAA